MRVTILGLGSWGTALAIRLGPRHELRGWTHDPGQREAMRQDGENQKYLPGVPLPPSLSIFDDPAQALPGADLVLFAVPSFAVRGLARSVKQDLGRTPVVNAAKGMEEGTGQLPLQVAGSWPGTPWRPWSAPVMPGSSAGPSTAVVATSLPRPACSAGERHPVIPMAILRIGAVCPQNVIAIAAGIAGDWVTGTIPAPSPPRAWRNDSAGTGLGEAGDVLRPRRSRDLVTTCVSPGRNRRVGGGGPGEPGQSSAG
jgi:glycerol-3-phosphate dehydrogenase (NAD(P)+)